MEVGSEGGEWRWGVEVCRVKVGSEGGEWRWGVEVCRVEVGSGAV